MIEIRQLTFIAMMAISGLGYGQVFRNTSNTSDQITVSVPTVSNNTISAAQLRGLPASQGIISPTFSLTGDSFAFIGGWAPTSPSGTGWLSYGWNPVLSYTANYLGTDIPPTTAIFTITLTSVGSSFSGPGTLYLFGSAFSGTWPSSVLSFSLTQTPGSLVQEGLTYSCSYSGSNSISLGGSGMVPNSSAVRLTISSSTNYNTLTSTPTTEWNWVQG